ncbi:type VI secretion system baseplate subunit TssG, partial [Serratia marcescens]|uniref:type VI secretion system baseplate subunit TssG n=1 Tax=Serratia marcescens TaxID=615 RepID=UPI00066661A1
MLSYAGMLASPSRSPEVISGLVMHCFDLESVEVEDWQMRKVAVCDEQQNRLGQSGVGLGQDFISGERVNDCAGKFVLKINNLSFRDFLRFLPDGDQHQPLVRFMSFILRDQLAWDLSLGFGHQQANGMRLDSHQGASLGWSSFLGTPPEMGRVMICVQE